MRTQSKCAILSAASISGYKTSFTVKMGALGSLEILEAYLKSTRRQIFVRFKFFVVIFSSLLVPHKVLNISAKISAGCGLGIIKKGLLSQNLPKELRNPQETPFRILGLSDRHSNRAPSENTGTSTY